MAIETGDKVRIRHTGIVGIVRSVTGQGNLGVNWDDGNITPDGMIHPDDVESIKEA